MMKQLRHIAYHLKLNLIPTTYNNLGNALQRILKTEEAISSYEKALLINPDLTHTFIQMVHLKQSICSWDGIEEMFSQIKKLTEKPINGKISPFALFSMPNLSNSNHLNVANSWVKQSGIKILQKILNKKSQAKLLLDIFHQILGCTLYII